MDPTCDPGVLIESRTPTSVVYFIPRTKERWRIDGVCNECGSCWEGASYEDVIGNRPTLDCPVRPGIKDDFPHCTLSGEYL